MPNVLARTDKVSRRVSMLRIELNSPVSELMTESQWRMIEFAYQLTRQVRVLQEKSAAKFALRLR
jgi:hypothetical protein